MLNETKKKKNVVKEEMLPAGSHENYMGGPSYDLSPFACLYVMATSSFFGENAYYEDVKCHPTESTAFAYLESVLGSFGQEMRALAGSKNRKDAMKQAIDKSLAYDAELTLRFLAWLRQEAYMRAVPAVGLAIASHADSVRGSHLLKDASRDILSRLDDVSNCLSYCLKQYGKPIPNGLKKVLAKRLSDASEYELAKYAGKKKKVTMRDVISLVHAHSPAIDKFCRNEISQTDEGSETWEAIISKEGSTKEAWTKAVAVMGHMALLRNLRNLEKNGVDESLYLDKLVSGVKNGKQLPFRYFSAYKNVTGANIRKALEQCIDSSIGNLPRLEGRSLILSDNSGSAVGARVSNLSNVNVSTCGNLMGILTGMVSEEGKLGLFGDTVKYIPINKGFSGTTLALLDTANGIGETVGYATENGVWMALDEAIRRKEHYDRIFIYSDMQAGHGGLFGLDSADYPVYMDRGRYIDIPMLVAEYRKKVNPDCKLYSIQIGGYADNIFPEFYPNTCILGGWTPEVLRFVSMFEENPVSVEDAFRRKFGLARQS